MSGFIINPTVGDVVVLATVCIICNSLSFLFLAHALGVALVSAARGLFKVVVPGMYGIHSPDQSSSVIEFSINIIIWCKQ